MEAIRGATKAPRNEGNGNGKGGEYAARWTGGQTLKANKLCGFWGGRGRDALVRDAPKERRAPRYETLQRMLGRSFASIFEGETPSLRLQIFGTRSVCRTKPRSSQAGGAQRNHKDPVGGGEVRGSLRKLIFYLAPGAKTVFPARRGVRRADEHAAHNCVWLSWASLPVAATAVADCCRATNAGREELLCPATAYPSYIPGTGRSLASSAATTSWQGPSSLFVVLFRFGVALPARRGHASVSRREDEKQRGRKGFRKVRVNREPYLGFLPCIRGL